MGFLVGYWTKLEDFGNFFMLAFPNSSALLPWHLLTEIWDRSQILHLSRGLIEEDFLGLNTQISEVSRVRSNKIWNFFGIRILNVWIPFGVQQERSWGWWTAGIPPLHRKIGHPELFWPQNLLWEMHPEIAARELCCLPKRCGKIWNPWRLLSNPSAVMAFGDCFYLLLEQFFGLIFFFLPLK